MREHCDIAATNCNIDFIGNSFPSHLCHPNGVRNMSLSLTWTSRAEEETYALLAAILDDGNADVFCILQHWQFRSESITPKRWELWSLASTSLLCSFSFSLTKSYWYCHFYLKLLPPVCVLTADRSQEQDERRRVPYHISSDDVSSFTYPPTTSSSEDFGKTACRLDAEM